jgi:hypothetical protein
MKTSGWLTTVKSDTPIFAMQLLHRSERTAGFKSSPFFWKTTHMPTPLLWFLLTPKAASSKLSLVMHEGKVPGIYYDRENRGFFLNHFEGFRSMEWSIFTLLSTIAPSTQNFFISPKLYLLLSQSCTSWHRQAGWTWVATMWALLWGRSPDRQHDGKAQEGREALIWIHPIWASEGEISRRMPVKLTEPTDRQNVALYYRA